MSNQDSDSRLAPSDKLRGANNYHQWKSRVFNILEGKDLEEYILASNVKPEPVMGLTDAIATRQAEIKVWKTNNARAMTTIQNNCQQQPNDLIADLRTASSMWEALREQYQGQEQNLKGQYLAEIQSMDYSKFSTITAFIIQFKKLHSALNQVDMKLATDFYTLTFIKALDTAYPIWADRWRSYFCDTSKTITLEKLYTDITGESKLRGPITDESNVALYANNPKNTKRSGNKSAKGANKKQSNKPKCNHCSKVGHKEEDCFIKHPEKKDAYKSKQKERCENAGKD